MPPRETGDGHGLRRSNRTEVVIFDLAAEFQQLWNAAAIRYELPLNGVAAWAIELLAKPGVKDGRRPPEMGVGLKRPKQKFQAGNRYSKEEKERWRQLKSTYPGGWAGVLTAALLDLYWREPFDLRRGSLIKPRWYPEDDEDGGLVD